jgi:large subunit ribosomal protein L3
MDIKGGLIGKKLGMTQVFNPNGALIGVTAIEVGPCVVVQKKTIETDGYSAIQLGFDDKLEKRAIRPEIGHFSKAGITPKKILKEFRLNDETVSQFNVGQSVGIEGLAVGDIIDISGISIGKGFAGVMKRYHFKGAKDTHGVHECFRHGGSLGMNMTPGHVIKGKKMPGHQGNSNVTIQNVEVVRVFASDNMIFVRGPIPGSKNSYLTIRPAIKNS